MEHEKRDVFGWARGLWRDRRPMVIAALVLIIGLPVVIYAALYFKAKPSPVIDEAITQAQASTEDGDYADAYNKLKATDGQAGTKDQQLELYSSLAVAAANAGKPQEAIDYLQKKHQLDPGTAPAGAFMLARLYEQTDNRIDALAQYKLALDYYKQQSEGDTLTSQSMVDSIEATIRELEAGDE